MHDGELIQRVRSGDEEAFAIFVQRHQDPLVNYLTHLTRSRTRAEEIAQEAFVRFYRNLANCRDEDRLGPYLFRIATNLARSENRRERRWLRLLPFLGDAFTSASPPADEPLVVGEIQTQVTAALHRLPDIYRAALVLFEIEEWSQEEIATALGCTVGTVKSRLFRARALMRRELEPWWIGGTHERHRQCAEKPAANESLA